jgi:hypothetical protein
VAVRGPIASGARNTSSWLRRTAAGAGAPPLCVFHQLLFRAKETGQREVIYTWCECPELNARTTWWLAPPTLHVFQDALPTAARFCRAVRQQVASLAAARGEHESFQLASSSPGPSCVRHSHAILVYFL